jgi:hypothetical protein
LKEAIASAHEYANFMKHAKTDAEKELDFDQNVVELLLFMVCHDFFRVTDGVPIEAQVFEAWWFATTTPKITKLPRRQQEKIKSRIRAFPPGLRSAPLAEQKRIALHTLNESANDPRFQMEIRRKVVLP